MGFHRPYIAYLDFDDRLLLEPDPVQPEAPAVVDGNTCHLRVSEHDIHTRYQETHISSSQFPRRNVVRVDRSSFRAGSRWVPRTVLSYTVEARKG